MYKKEFHLRTTPSIFKKIKNDAILSNRSINSQINFILEKKYGVKKTLKNNIDLIG